MQDPHEGKGTLVLCDSQVLGLIPISHWALAPVLSDKTVANAKTANPKIKQ